METACYLSFDDVLAAFPRNRHNRTMPSRLLPLFPLQVVVFPGSPLPLHIFEERYKEMVGDAIRDNSEFGIVLAREDGIVNAGCTVVVEKLTEMHPDGRMDILTRGRRRFQILSLNEEKSYLQAEVEFFDDEDFRPPPAELKQEALTHFSALRELGAAREISEPDEKDPQLSFHLAQAIPDVNFLSTLLRQRSETGRLRELNHFLEQYIPRQRAIERLRALAPTNGYGGKHVEM
jgi:Lon protease-like protein